MRRLIDNLVNFRFNTEGAKMLTINTLSPSVLRQKWITIFSTRH